MFYKFPHTPHIAWLGKMYPRDDKVLDPNEADEFLSHKVIIEEKVDGANLGFSIDEHGELRAQNRGSYLSLDNCQGQWSQFKRWLTPRADALAEALFPDLILFGEWCYARHSIPYTRLPDWFLAFDVYDRASQQFWDTRRRDELVDKLGLCTVPLVTSGEFDMPQLSSMAWLASRLVDEPMEGIYIRREYNGSTIQRAKLVRPTFTQAIDEHWSRRSIEQNTLVTR